MVDERVVAAINLHSILRNIEDLCEMDEQSRQVIGNKCLTIRFYVPDLEKLYLVFGDNECRAVSGGTMRSNLNLRFFGSSHFNKMIEGTKNPLPTKGFRHIDFLKNDFTKLAERLEFYLKTTKEDLLNKDFNKNSTILTSYTAFFALSQIANYDRIGKSLAHHIEDGVINIEVKDSIGIHVVIKDGKFTTVKGVHPNPKARMVFSDLNVAGGILRGELDSFACMGESKLAVFGRIPMVDYLNKLLSLVSVYLA